MLSGFSAALPSRLAGILALVILAGQVLARSGSSSIAPGTGPDHKLTDIVLAAAPDPFSPNEDLRNDSNIILVRSDVTPTDGLKSQGQGAGKVFFLQAIISIRHPETGLPLRSLEAEAEIASPPPDWGLERLRVEAQAVFDGRDDSGALLPDAVYPYDAEVSFVRLDAVRNGPPHVKIIDSDFVQGGTIEIDTSPPRFDSLSPEDGHVSDVPNAVIEGTLSEPATLLINGIPVEVSTERSFTFETTLDPGENVFTILAEDFAGNQTTQSILIIFDNVPPAVRIEDPSPGSFVSTREPTVRVLYSDPQPGSGVDLATLVISLDGVDVTPSLDARDAGETVLVPLLPLSEGLHTVTAVLQDRARNVGEAAPVDFTVDVSPPVLTVTRPKDDLLTNQSLTPVSGTVNEEGTVTINGVPTPLIFTEVSPFTGAQNAVFPPILTLRREGPFVDGFEGPALNDPWTDVINLIPEFGGIPVRFANGEMILDTGFRLAGSPSVVVGAITKPDRGFAPQSFHVQVDMTIEELIGSFEFGLRVGAADVRAQPPEGANPLELFEIAFGKAFEPGMPSQTSVVLRWRQGQTDEQAGVDLSFAPGETWRFSLAYDHVGKTVHASLAPGGGIPAFEHTVQNLSIDEPFGVAVFSSAGEPDGPTVVFDSKVVIRADNFVSDLVVPQVSQISFSPLSLSGVDYDQAPTPQGVVTGIALFLPTDFDPSTNEPPPLILTDPSPVPLDGTTPINLALVTFSPALGSARTTIYTPLSESQLAAFFSEVDQGGSSIDAFVAPLFEPLLPGPGYGPAQFPTGGSGIFVFDTTTPLSEGENVVEIIATDRAGNFAIKERHPTLDTIPPVVTVEYPPDGLLTNQNPVTVRGTVNEPAIVYVNGIPIDLTGAPQDVSVAPGFGQSVTLVPGASETLSEDFSQGIPGGWTTASNVFQPSPQTPLPIVESVGGQVVLDTLLQAQGTSGASASLALSDSFNVSQGFDLSVDFQVQILEGGGGFGITLREPDVPMGQQGGEIGESILRASFNLDPNNRGNVAFFSVRTSGGGSPPPAFQELGPILDGTVLTFSLSYEPTLSYTISARIFDNQRQQFVFDQSIPNFTIDFPVTLAFQALAAEFGPFAPGSQPLLSDSRVRVGINNLTSNLAKPGGYRMSLSPMQTAGQVYGQVVGPQGVVPGLTGAFFFGQGDPVIVSSPGTLLPGVDGSQNINVALINLGSFPARVTAYTTSTCDQLLALVRQFDPMTSLDACVEPILRSQGAGNPYLYTPPAGGLPSGPLEVTIPERFTSPGSLSFLPSGPFEDNFDSGLPFTFWRLSGSGLWEGNTGDVGVDSLGRLRMEVASQNQGNRNFVMTSVPKFARQSFSSSIEVMIDPTSTGAYDLFFNFGLLPVEGTAGRLICARLPVAPDPFTPGAFVSTCDAFTSDSFPSEGSFPNLVENVAESDLLGHTLTLTIDFDANASTFIGRVEDRTVSPPRVLFASGPIPAPALNEFRLAFGASAGRFGSPTEPGASGRIVTYWDNFSSSLTREGSYFVSHTAFALGGVPYADFVEFLPGTSGPIFIEGEGLSADTPPAQISHDFTGVEEVDGLSDYNVALISVAGFIRLTIIAAQSREALEQALLELEQREGISTNIDAFFPSVFKAPGAFGLPYGFELPPPVEGPPPVLDFQIPLPLAEGPNTISVYAVDWATNESLPVVRTVTLDTIPPTLVLAFPEADRLVTKDVSIVLTGTFSESGSVTINGESVGVDLTTLSFSTIFSLVEGDNSFNYELRDRADNVTRLSKLIISDRTAPLVSIQSPPEGVTRFTTHNVQGSITDITNTTADLLLNGFALTPTLDTSSGFFVISDVPLREGPNEIVLVVRDEVGNQTTVSRTTIVDTIAPLVFIDFPEDRFETNERSLVLEGHFVDQTSVVITVNGIEVVTVDDNFSFLASLQAEGETFFVAQAVDAAGNIGQSTPVAIILDTTPPSTPLTDPDIPVLTNQSFVTISGTAEPGSTVKAVSEIDTRILEADASTGRFSGSFGLIFNQANGFSLTALDRAGNESGAALITITHDNVPPISSLVLGEPSFVRGTETFISSSTPITLHASDSGSGIARIEFSLGGEYFMFSEAFYLDELGDGTYPLAFRSIDKAGNEEIDNVTALGLDNSAPQVAITRTISENGTVVVEGTVSDAAGVDHLRVEGLEATIDLVTGVFTSQPIIPDGSLLIEFSDVLGNMDQFSYPVKPSIGREIVEVQRDSRLNPTLVRWSTPSGDAIMSGRYVYHPTLPEPILIELEKPGKGTITIVRDFDLACGLSDETPPNEEPGNHIRCVTETWRDPDGTISTYKYVFDSKVLADDKEVIVVKNSLGDRRTVTFDPHANTLVSENTLGHRLTIEMEDLGVDPTTLSAVRRISRVTSPNGIVRRYVYDENDGRPLSVVEDGVGPNGEDSVLQYIYDGDRIAGFDQNGIAILNAVLEDGRVFHSFQVHKGSYAEIYDTLDPAGERTIHRLVVLDDETIETSYDQKGHTLTETTIGSEGLTTTTTSQYDSEGRLLFSQTDGGVTEYVYDGDSSRVLQIIENAIPAVTYEYDSLGRLIQAARSGVTTNWEDWDEPAGQARTITFGADGRKVSYQSEFDVKGRLIFQTLGDYGSLTYTYDEADRIRGLSRSDGSETRITYDVLGRTEEFSAAKLGQSEDITYFYDGSNPLGIVSSFGVGRLTGVRTTTNAKAVSYEPSGMVGEEHWRIAGDSFVVKYAHSLEGSLVGVTYPDGKKAEYPHKNPALIFDGTTIINELEVNKGGLLSAIYPSGTGTGSLTDIFGRVEMSLLVQPVGADDFNVIRGRAYEYSDRDITKEIRDNEEITFSYDTQNRITKWVSDTGRSEEIAYDPLGNRTSLIRTGFSPTESITYEYMPDNKMDSVSTNGVLTSAYTYDAGGRVSSISSPDGDVRSFGYDPRGNLSSYDENGRRVSEYFYDENNYRTLKRWHAEDCSGEFRFVHGGHDWMGRKLLHENGSLYSSLGAKIYEGHRNYLWAGSQLVAIDEDVTHLSPEFACREAYSTEGGKEGNITPISGIFADDFEGPAYWLFDPRDGYADAKWENGGLRQVNTFSSENPLETRESILYSSIGPFRGDADFTLSIKAHIDAMDGPIADFGINMYPRPTNFGSGGLGCVKGFHFDPSNPLFSCHYDGGLGVAIGDPTGQTITLKISYSRGRVTWEIPEFGLEKVSLVQGGVLPDFRLVLRTSANGRMDVTWDDLVTSFPFSAHQISVPPVIFLGDEFKFGPKDDRLGKLWALTMRDFVPGVDFPRLAFSDRDMVVPLDGITTIDATLATKTGTPRGTTIVTTVAADVLQQLLTGYDMQKVANVPGLFRVAQSGGYLWNLPQGRMNMLPGRAKKLFVHSDIRRVPFALSDESGDIVWERDVTPFGVTSDLRLPIVLNGQYADFETGLHYNVNRYYDPVLGRYIQADSVRLPNLYVFANNNPMRFSDPLGLFSIETDITVGLGVCGKVWKVEKCWDLIKFGDMAVTPGIHEEITAQIRDTTRAYNLPLVDESARKRLIPDQSAYDLLSISDFEPIYGSVMKKFADVSLSATMALTALGGANALQNGVVAGDMEHGLPWPWKNYDQAYHFDNSDFAGGYSMADQIPSITGCQEGTREACGIRTSYEEVPYCYPDTCSGVRTECFDTTRTIKKRRCFTYRYRSFCIWIKKEEPYRKCLLTRAVTPCERCTTIRKEAFKRQCWNESYTFGCRVNAFQAGLYLHPAEDFFAHSTAIERGCWYGQNPLSSSNNCGGPASFFTGNFSGNNLASALQDAFLCRDIDIRVTVLGKTLFRFYMPLPRNPRPHCEVNKDKPNQKDYALGGDISELFTQARSRAIERGAIQLRDWCSKAPDACY